MGIAIKNHLKRNWSRYATFTLVGGMAFLQACSSADKKLATNMTRTDSCGNVVHVVNRIKTGDKVGIEELKGTLSAQRKDCESFRTLALMASNPNIPEGDRVMIASALLFTVIGRNGEAKHSVLRAIALESIETDYLLALEVESEMDKLKSNNPQAVSSAKLALTAIRDARKYPGLNIDQELLVKDAFLRHGLDIKILEAPEAIKCNQPSADPNRPGHIIIGCGSGRLSSTYGGQTYEIVSLG